MKIVEYNNYNNIIIEFDDEFKAKLHTNYNAFIKGSVKNPYYRCIYGVAAIGAKYPSRIDSVQTKEYCAWYRMLYRCFDERYKNKYITYEDVSCCDEWLLYENFYEWLHSQKNFDRWFKGQRWDVDKDILTKGNKVYSPSTCTLVPHNINVLFTKKPKGEDGYPRGVCKHSDRFIARYESQIGERHIGVFDTAEEAFIAYKQYKEDIIKQIAQIEFDVGNITEECYNAMLRYEVEITD